ncbi:hypothetical protein [Caballeronia sp. LZ016]|nr:hypothetical protein [Caballeronia sp. LZ016]MDR5740846.1 hypothetical protein [Caballeronia sp. LZ016]
MANIIQTAKQMVKANVLAQSTRQAVVSVAAEDAAGGLTTLIVLSS